MATNKYTTSYGVPWEEVKWEDLPRIIERGEKAKALMAAREKLEAGTRELAAEVAKPRSKPQVE